MTIDRHMHLFHLELKEPYSYPPNQAAYIECSTHLFKNENITNLYYWFHLSTKYS